MNDQIYTSSELVPKQTVTQKRRRSKPKLCVNPVWVKKDTRDSIYALLGQLNLKDKGRKIRPDDLISSAIKLVTPEHIRLLQEQSITYKERFEKNYREYIKFNGDISKDVYLGILLAKEN